MVSDAVVLVSGMPGAGKSTLAAPLAASLRLTLLSKDVIKEQLYDSLPPAEADPLVWSRTLGAASMELLWRLAELAPQVLLEANFRPRSRYERERLTGLGRPIVEVHCVCPPQLAARRYAERATRPTHHRGAHPTATLAQTMWSEFDRPVALGPVITVDTTGPVDLPSLARQVAVHLPVQPADPGPNPGSE